MMNSCRIFFLCTDFKSYCTELKLCCIKFKLYCTDFKLCCTKFKLYCIKFKSYCTELKLYCTELKLHCIELKLCCCNLKSVIIGFKQDDLYLISEEMSLSFIFIMPDLLIFKRSISHHLVFFPFTFNSFYYFEIKFCIKVFGCGIIIKNI